MELLLHVADVSACFADAFLALFFVTKFNNENLQKSKKSLFFILALTSVDFATSLAVPTPFSLIAVYIVNIFFLIIYSFTALPSISFFSKITPPFIFQSIYCIVQLFSAVIILNIFHTDIFSALFSDNLQRIVYLAVNKILLFLAITLLISARKKIVKSKLKNKIYLWLIPLPMISLMLILFLPILMNFCGSVYGFFTAYYIITIVITLTSTVGIYFMLYEIQLKIRLEKETELYQEMLKAESKRYDDIVNSSNRIFKIRHDIKNMLMSVKTQIDIDDMEKANENLCSILESVSTIGTVINSENRTIDYIVNAKLGALSNTGISVFGDVSGFEKIDDIDLSIMLGNMLDNALEATNDLTDTEILLSFFTKNRYLNILCKNSINESVLLNNPSLSTSKNDEASHGFGTKSMVETAKKYDGTIDFFEKDNMFCVHIMLPIK